VTGTVFFCPERTAIAVIRTEDQFTLNVTLVVCLLAVTTVLFLFVQAFAGGRLLGSGGSTFRGAALRIFFHNDAMHFAGNIFAFLIVGLVLAAFAQPGELGGVFGATLTANTLIYHYILPDVAGLSLTLFAVYAATLLFLLAGFIEARRLDSTVEQIAVALLTVCFIAGVFYLMREQLWHDLLVVFAGTEPTIGGSNYTRGSSTAHVSGFIWGLVCAAGVLAYRYRERLQQVAPASV
jgi:hypothetical protein